MTPTFSFRLQQNGGAKTTKSLQQLCFLLATTLLSSCNDFAFFLQRLSDAIIIAFGSR